MPRHCGFARVAANRALATFSGAWFTESGTDGVWLSDMNLRKAFNAVKRDVYSWSAGLCRYVGKNAIRNMANGIQHWGQWCKAGRLIRRVEFSQHRRKGRHMSFAFTNGRNTARVDGATRLHPGRGLGAHAEGTAVPWRHPEHHRVPADGSLVHCLPDPSGRLQARPATGACHWP